MNCQHEGCEREGETCYHCPDGPTEYFCPIHAADHGYCHLCGGSLDHGVGICDNCRDESDDDEGDD